MSTRAAFARILTAAVLATAAFGGSALAAEPVAPPPVTATDHVLGRADAPVTVIEYASLTCPHCADWHDEILPALKAKYVDAGKVRFVYRTLPTPPANVATAAAGVAQCAAPGRFFDVIDAFFAAQSLLPTQGTGAYFERGVAAAGRTRDEIRDCLSQPATQQAVEGQIDGAQAAGVTHTPYFFVNGRAVDDVTLQGLTAAIDPHLAGR